MSRAKLTIASVVLTVAATLPAMASGPIQVAGSSTVYPYAVMSADSFIENHNFDYPDVQSGGSSAGLKQFCQGTGADSLDIATASRKIKAKEVKACADNGVRDIIEVRIGYDGLVFANSVDSHSYNFTPADWFRALAPQVLVDGQMVDNTATTWDQVNGDFPSENIRTFLPSSSHGTREVFDLKMMVEGCKATGAYDVLLQANGGDAKAAKKACMKVRSDEVVVELDGGGRETLDSIRSAANSIGVVGLAFYEGNTNFLQAASISGVAPSSDSIANGEYPVSRALYMYVKKANIAVTPGLKEYVQSVLSDEMSGPGGFLTIFGLVSDPEIQATRQMVNNEVVMSSS